MAQDTPRSSVPLHRMPCSDFLASTKSLHVLYRRNLLPSRNMSLNPKAIFEYKLFLRERFGTIVLCYHFKKITHFEILSPRTLLKMYPFLSEIMDERGVTFLLSFHPPGW